KPRVRTRPGTPASDRTGKRLFRLKAQDRVAKDGEIVVRERSVRALRNEEFRGALIRRQEKAIFRPPISDRVLRGPYRVRHLTDRSPFDRLVDRIALELFHVPGAVDLEMGPQFQEAVVGHEEGAALDREDDQRPLVRVEVMGKKGEPIRIAFRRAGEAEERRVVEGIRVAHRCGEGSPEDERSRETGTLKRTAFMVPLAVSPTKLDEAKAALERGAFDEALRLIEVANAGNPGGHGPSRFCTSWPSRSRRTSRCRSRSERSNDRANDVATLVSARTARAAVTVSSSASTENASGVTAAASARPAAYSSQCSSSSRSARAGSLPSIHSTRSARPISPHERHSQPRA